MSRINNSISFSTEATTTEHQLPQVDFCNAFSVVSGPDRQAMNFPSPANQKPKPTEFTVELPCGPTRLALCLLGNYFYSRIDTQLIQLTGEVVDISSDDGNKLLPSQAAWHQTLKENPIRMCYDISKHTGKLFLKSATQLTATASA